MADFAHKAKMVDTGAQSCNYLKLAEKNTLYSLAGWSSCVHFPYLNVILRFFTRLQWDGRTGCQFL
jgi:hypothetical protein